MGIYRRPGGAAVLDIYGLGKPAMGSFSVSCVVQLVVRKTGFKDGTFEIVCGARRHQAAKIAGLKTVPVLVRELDDKAALEVQVIENLQREDVHPLEEAEGYEALMKKHGYKRVEDIAVKVGKSTAYVYGRIKLCDLTPENRKRFYAGKFLPSAALLVARVPKHLQDKAGREIGGGDNYGSKEPLTYGEVRNYIKNNLMLEIKNAPFSPNAGDLGGKPACKDCPKRTSNEKLLFPDMIKDDRCTDPNCWEIKKAAHFERIKLNAIKEGKTILPAAEVKKQFNYGTSLSGNSRFVKLEDTPGYGSGVNDKDAYKPFRTLLRKAKAKDIKTVFAPAAGQLIELAEKKEVAAALKAGGLMDKKMSTHQAAAAESRKQERIRKAARAKIISALVEEIGKDKRQSFIPFLARLVKTVVYYDAARIFVQRRYPDAKQDVRDKFDAYHKQLKEKELLTFCMEALLSNEAIYHGYGDVTLAVAKHYKIDVKKIAAATRAEFAFKKVKGKVKK